MNLHEILGLLDTVSEFGFTASEKPSFIIYDNQLGGYNLLLKVHAVNNNFNNWLREIVKNLNLSIREFEGYLIIRDY